MGPGVAEPQRTALAALARARYPRPSAPPGRKRRDRCGGIAHRLPLRPHGGALRSRCRGGGAVPKPRAELRARRSARTASGHREDVCRTDRRTRAGSLRARLLPSAAGPSRKTFLLTSTRISTNKLVCDVEALP